MATILVTGGAGYIGSHTIVDLIEHGFDVISIDNFSNSNKQVFDGVKKITNQNVTNYNIDLTNLDDTKTRRIDKNWTLTYFSGTNQLEVGQ